MSEFSTAQTAEDFRVLQETAVTRFDLDGQLYPTSTKTRVPAPGEVVDGVYTIESVTGPRRFVATHRILEEPFEIRLLPFLPPSEEIAAIESAVRAANLVGNCALGVVADMSYCAQFGTYAAVEIVTGTTLAELLERDELASVDEVAHLALEVGGALGSLHEVGVAHGLVDLNDVVRTADGWRLMGAGLPPEPGTDSRYRAPEVSDFGDVTAKSDQWAFAAVLFELLAGHRPQLDDLQRPGSRRDDVPEKLGKAILRALSRDPNHRWRQMETILDVLQSSFQVWRQPSMVPLDAREVSRLLKVHPDATGDFSRVSEQTRQSVVVKVGDLRRAKPNMTLAFRSVARLRREYRHNLAHGGIFVPTPTPPSPADEVSVTLELTPTGATVDLDGVVTHKTEGDGVSPPGAGVVFDAESVQRLLEFLRGCGVVKSLRAHDIVVRMDDYLEIEALTADELFMYSLLIGEVTVGYLRSECSAAPLDFEETLHALADRGAVMIRPSDDGAFDEFAFRPSRPAGAQSESKLDYAPEEIDLLLEQIEFHIDRNSFLAAHALAQRGLRHLPDEPRLHHQLALIQARGLHELMPAIESIRHAVELEPGRLEFRESLGYVERLLEADAIRRIYYREFPVTDCHFVGWDAARSYVWALTRSQLQPNRARLLGIDVVRDTIVHSETIEESSDVHVVWSPQASAGEVPTIFRGAFRPVAVSDDGERWAFDHHPDDGEEGVYVSDRGGTQLRRLSSAEGCEHIAFSPSADAVAWLERRGRACRLWVRRGEDEATVVFEADGPARYFWTAEDRLTVYHSETGIVWSIGEDGEMEDTGMVDPGFTRALVDSTGDRVALVYDGSETSVLLVDMADGRHIAECRFGHQIYDAALRADGSVVARTRNGVMVASLETGAVREVEGIRIGPTGWRAARWIGSRPFVGMVTRPNALELVAIRPELLLA